VKPKFSETESSRREPEVFYYEFFRVGERKKHMFCYENAVFQIIDMLKFIGL
jgi:hypothetical protein